MAPPYEPTAPGRDADADSIARSAALVLASRLATALFTALLTVYLARALGPASFGVFALALGFSGIVKLPSDFGISQATARFAAERRGDRPALARLLAGALRLKLGTAGVVCLALFAAAGLIADAYGEPDLATPLRAIAIALFAENLMMLYGGVFVALARSGLAMRMSLTESVVETAASVAFVLLSTTASSAAWGRTAGYSAGAVVALVLVLRTLGGGALRPTHEAAERTQRRLVARYAAPLLLIDGAYALFQQIDVLLLGAYLGAEAAGLFQAPLRLIAFLGYPAEALANGVAPRLARHIEGRRVDALRAGARYVLLMQAALLPPLLVWAEPIVDHVLGPGYGDSAAVLRALAPVVFLFGFGVLLSLTVNYLGEARRRLPVAAAAVLLNALIDVLLIPPLGVVAGAVGTGVAYAFYVGGHVWVARRLLPLPLRPLLPTALRAAVAAAAMAGVLLAVGTGDVGVAAVLCGGAGGLLVYGLVLVAIGELTVAELRTLARSARGGR